MTKKNMHNDEDDSFRELFGDAEPIKPQNIKPKPAQTKKISLPPRQELEFIEPNFHDALEPEESIFFAQGGLQAKQIRNLKQGKVAIDARLDLHGMNWSQAHHSLQEFFEHVLAKQCKTVIIIPGKGRVLKSALNHYLREQKFILAFCTAQAKHGGTGSFYVLLSRKI